MKSKLIAAIGFLILVATAFQNCAEDFNNSLDSVRINTNPINGQLDLPSLDCEGSDCPDPNILEPCMFNGEFVLPGEAVMAFEKSSVSYGATCKSEMRFCGSDGLTGSHQYASCAVGAPASCLHSGITIPHGEALDTYAASTVPFGQSCKKVSLACHNGSLSSDPAATPFTSCSVGAPASCAYNGGTLAHGQSITAYTKSSVPYGEQCPVKTVSCHNGSITNGSAIYSSCSVQAPITRWVNSSGVESHFQTCSRAGLFPSKDKGYGVCASGELRPNQGTDHAAIRYVYGTWGGTRLGGSVVGSYCYRSGQKRDSDGTDRIVAYLCSQEPN